MSNVNTILKKRGRKPKNKCEENKVVNIPINSEDEQIIVHLPISLEDVVNMSDNNNIIKDDLNIFIKSENDINKSVNNKPINNEEIINKKMIDMEKKLMVSNHINKVNVHNIIFKPGNKCLWCKNSFDTPAVMLPDDYYNNTFYCTGNYCSWNCAKAYNIDLNDTTTWRRESLLNLMFYKTYGVFKEIIPAASWLLLEDFGGFMNIIDFKKLFITNTKDYLVLHPPLITRQLQIEESYKKYAINNGNKSESAYDNELVLKRFNPMENNNLNLEKTIGLKRKTKKFVSI